MKSIKLKYRRIQSYLFYKLTRLYGPYGWPKPGSYTPEMSLDKGLGLGWLWRLPSSHWGHEAGVWHDEQYILRAKGELKKPTSLWADQKFYDMLLELAELEL